MRVFQFSPNKTPWDSYATLQSQPETLMESDQFSMCYRLKIFRFMPYIYWINIATYSIREDPTCCEIRTSKRLQ